MSSWERLTCSAPCGQQCCPADRLAALKTRHARQVHINPSQLVASLFLNTRLAPFDHLDARRALSYAIDRAQPSSPRVAPTKR